MNMPSVGIVLPSHRLPHEPERDLARDFRGSAEAAAAAGAETLWVWDHMLKAPVYRDAWHDPLISLASVADFGLRLGTGILVAPVRPPVQTAMAVATLQSLSRQPMRLGVGTGWNPPEFQAAGVAREHRGALTDEFLEVVDAVFAGETEFSGRFHSFSDLDTGYIGGPPDIWIAGGSRAAGGGRLGEQERAKNATMAPAVAERILKYGRWIVRPTAERTDYERDTTALAEAAESSTSSRSPADVTLSVISVGYLVETDDPVVAREKQLPEFAHLVSDKRPPDYIEDRYLVGSLGEVRARLESWIDVGMEHIGLYLMGDVPSQVALAKKHLGDLLDFRS